MKRFYKQAAAHRIEGGWQVMLDGRAIRTARGAPQVVPNMALAQALAAEWDEQPETIDPAGLIFRDLTDFAIDLVAADREGTIGRLLEYGETDTLCYRADPEDALFAHQQKEWEPLLRSIEARHALRFCRISGVIHTSQPRETMARLRRSLHGFDHFALAALQSAAALAASLCIALETARDDCDPQELWRLASLEEEWQAQLWGRDEMAEKRNAQRRRAFVKACDYMRLLRS